MFLTDAELIELTGYTKQWFVRKWLDAHGYKYEIARNGWPRVLRSSVTDKLGASSRREPRLNLA